MAAADVCAVLLRRGSSCPIEDGRLGHKVMWRELMTESEVMVQANSPAFPTTTPGSRTPRCSTRTTGIPATDDKPAGGLGSTARSSSVIS
ncbi:hypothetical protein IU427_24815 [Nocardia beijingensis]|uniref:hypothetical protein n=1 Tax=Nocardia beijingensis TaxID=95162 RepID=UPI0018958A52|nr:hypothetical protein [Nocardia beijingensis]MBF6468366.1 hypothetical protein [Nocardia beijingensis]